MLKTHVLPVILRQILGGLIYAPFLLGGIWMANLNRPLESLNMENPLLYLTDILAGILFVIGFNCLAKKELTKTFSAGVKLGATLGIFFVAFPVATQLAFSGVSAPAIFVSVFKEIFTASIVGGVIAINIKKEN